MTGKQKLAKRKNRAGYIFVLPFIIGLVFIFVPTLIQSLIYSFSDVKINFNNISTTFVGLKNYKDSFLTDVYFREILLNAVSGILTNTLIILIFSFFISNLLNQKFVGKGLARVVFFLPVILATGIIAAADANNLVTNIFSSESNTANSVATAFSSGGFSKLFNLKSIITAINISPNLTNTILYAIDNTYSIVNSSGVQILIFLSALQSISPSLFESARVEGATKWEEFWKITFPILTPMILVNSVYTIVDCFTNPKYKVLEYIKVKAFNDNLFGFASSMSWIFFLIIAIIIGIVFALVSRRVHYLD